MKKALVVISILGMGMQFIPVSKNQSDEVPKTDFLQTNEGPVTIQKMIKAACYDCHSNNTNYPWYGRVRPFAWLLQKHIDEGKEELNFSTFQEYSGRMQREKVRSMISQIRDDKMPLKKYLWMHAEAEMSDSEKEQLIEYLEELNTQ